MGSGECERGDRECELLPSLLAGSMPDVTDLNTPTPTPTKRSRLSMDEMDGVSEDDFFPQVGDESEY